MPFSSNLTSFTPFSSDSPFISDRGFTSDGRFTSDGPLPVTLSANVKTNAFEISTFVATVGLSYCCKDLVSLWPVLSMIYKLLRNSFLKSVTSSSRCSQAMICKITINSSFTVHIIDRITQTILWPTGFDVNQTKKRKKCNQPNYNKSKNHIDNNHPHTFVIVNSPCNVQGMCRLRNVRYAFA